MKLDSTQVAIVRKGGAALADVRNKLVEFAQVGVTFEQIEALAQKLIKQHGMKPSFSTVSGYSWATCVMKNHQLCHGIPQAEVIEAADLITIDVGLINQDRHLDTTTTFQVEPRDDGTTEFLAIGRKALRESISRVKAGARVYDVSRGMEKVLSKHELGVIYQLTGHGIGTRLHTAPSIPCVAQRADKQVLLEEGSTIAVEVMYSAGDPRLVVAADGWTYQTADGSLTAMFEETLLVTKNGSEVLTKAGKKADSLV